MEYINAITSKDDWFSKIHNNEITTKWKNELSNELNENQFNLIIDMLKNFDNDLESYNWFTSLYIDAHNISSHCNCKCIVCKGDEWEDENQSLDYDNYSANCLCFQNVRKNKLIYLNKFVKTSMYRINQELKNELKTNIELFKNTIDKIYHPYTNNSQIDIIHPSLNTYIKNVTPLINDNIISDNVIFQWLAVNVINGELELNDKMSLEEKTLYKTINKIFKDFIPMFEHCLVSLHYNNCLINNYKPKSISNNCQVIVKLQRLYLDGNDSYDLSNWHLEGTCNEHIIATGIYYYDMENIDDHYLKFRSCIHEDIDCELNYPQNCHMYANYHYGFNQINHNQLASITLGKIKTVKDLCLVFPNTMQHKVTKIEKIDKTKPAYRDILVFFLVDPTEKILSINDVVQVNLDQKDKLIYEEILMYQRKKEIKEQDKIYTREVSLCEH
jgi:hypothetical protein